MIRPLLDAGCPIAAAVEPHRLTAMHLAADRGSAAGLRELLAAPGGSELARVSSADNLLPLHVHIRHAVVCFR